MKDMESNIDVMASIDPAAAFTTSQNGVGVDLRGYDGALGIFTPGVADVGSADETYIPGFDESVDNSTFTAVAAGDIEGDVTTLVTDTPRRIGYKGNKRYIRAKITIAGTTPSIIAGACIARGLPRTAPLA